MTKNASIPLFILGNPRSGTSLFRLMLTSHPSIIVPPECGYIQWWYDKYSLWSEDFSSDPKKVQEFLEDLKRSKKIETWKLNYSELGELILSHKPGTYGELCLLVKRQYSFQQGKLPLIYGDKNNYYTKYGSLLHRIFPEGKFILLVRDGRDVACSYKNLKNIVTESAYKPNLPTDIYEIAKEWVENNETVLDFFKQLPAESYRIIRYEDVLRSSQEVLKGVCNFLDLDYNSEMLRYSELNQQNNLEPMELMSWKRKTYEQPDVFNIGKYHKELKSEEITEFNDLAGNMLKFFGYE